MASAAFCGGPAGAGDPEAGPAPASVPVPLSVGVLVIFRHPQQIFLPSATSMLSTPSAGVLVTSLVPVLMKSSPLGGAGTSAPSTISAIASTPCFAISSGYCCEVASIVPSSMASIAWQPPSTDTMKTSLASMPAALSASSAPYADGSLIV